MLGEVADEGWCSRLRGAPDFSQEFLPKFTLRGELGHGTFGKVFWARCTRDGVRWTSAVKLMEAKLDQKKRLEYWAREAHIWQTASPHPNILHLHEVYYGTAEGLQKVAMVNELMDRVLLMFFTHYACVDAEDARTWMSDLCTGLGHMHGLRLAHRDMKPANCLLKHRPGAQVQLVIGDFGQAAVLQVKAGEKATARINSLNESPCTWEYAAPEVVHKRGYDFKLDVWSAGAILWQMLQAPVRNGQAGVVLDIAFLGRQWHGVCSF